MTVDRNLGRELADIADRLASLVALLVERYGVVSRPVQRASQARRLVERLREERDEWTGA